MIKLCVDVCQLVIILVIISSGNYVSHECHLVIILVMSVILLIYWL